MKYKLLTAIVSLAMVIAMSPGITASDTNEEYVGAIDTPDGTIYLTEEDLNQLETEDGHCAGDAPFENYCVSVESGERNVLWFAHRCIGDADYTGQVESRLNHDDGARHWVCDFEDGQLVNTYGEGEWPSYGDEFQHEGYSYFADTWNTGLGELFGPVSDGEPIGIPGGTGGWGVSLPYGY